MKSKTKFIPGGRHAYQPGEKFGMMTLIEYSGRVKSRGLWLAECECGERRHINPHQYRTGRSKSCGCYQYSPEHIAAMKAGRGGYRKVQLRDPKNIRLLRSFRGLMAEEFIHPEFRLA